MRKILEALKAKWAEYVLEIIVIVIGILGAFGLDNWNEERKERALETKILIEIAENIESNISNLEEALLILDQYNKSGKIILSVLDTKTPFTDTLARHFGLAIQQGGGDVARYTKAGYEVLKNVGVQVIQSDSLRKLIVNLFEVNVSWLQYRINRYHALFPGYNIYIKKLFYSGPSRNLIPIDHAKVLNDKFYYSILTSINQERGGISYWYTVHIEAYNDVLKLIKKELEKKE